MIDCLLPLFIGGKGQTEITIGLRLVGCELQYSGEYWYRELGLPRLHQPVAEYAQDVPVFQFHFSQVAQHPHAQRDQAFVEKRIGSIQKKSGAVDVTGPLVQVHEIQILIGGISIQGTEPVRVLITAKGPSLTAFGVAGALANPRLALFSGATQIAANSVSNSTENRAPSAALNASPS